MNPRHPVALHRIEAYCLFQIMHKHREIADPAADYIGVVGLFPRIEILLDFLHGNIQLVCQSANSMVEPGAVVEPRTTSNGPRQATELLRAKQGLIGFANGFNTAAMTNTGSRKNVMSESYAKKLNLTIESSPSMFEIGSSRKLQSMGTVSLLWAFAENPKETFSIVCHVISCCTYDLILGNGFPRATKTLTKFCHRLTRCLFSVANNVPHFNFLGETCQRLEGTLANEHSVLAIPDTGADRNIMSLQCAVNQGFDLKIGQKHFGYLQFADGSYDKTVGQVETYWTFANGVRIPVTFEILEHCCSDVIIGEKILTEQNVSVKHSASVLLDTALDGDDGDDSYELAPFDFMNSWQRLHSRLKDKTASLLAKGGEPNRNDLHSDNARIQEQQRRNMWNYKYHFGTNASAVEEQLELARRERYDSERASMLAQGSNAAPPNTERASPQHRIPVVPSVPTSRTYR